MLPTILTGAAGRALKTLAPLETVATTQPKAELRMLVEVARGDIHKALGPDAGRVAVGELHAAAQNVANGVSSYAGDVIAIHRSTLESVASSTARTRIVLGSLALGGGIAGAMALASRGDEGRIMAPGLPGAPGTEPVRA